METYPYQTPDGIIDLVRKSEFDRLKWEMEEVKEKLDWQNHRNSGMPTRGGYEFYINEEWLSGGTPSLMRERFDPDDERVRVRRTIEDDYLLAEIDKLRSELTRWQSLAGLLAAPLDFIVTKTDAGKICFHNLYDSTAEMAYKALAAYESAKKGELPEMKLWCAYCGVHGYHTSGSCPQIALAEAVKQMEAVPMGDLWKVFDDGGRCLTPVRARLIQAATSTTGKPEITQ